MTSQSDYDRREKFVAQAATTERTLWGLAHRLNNELADKLLKANATAEQALESIEIVMQHAPQTTQAPAPQVQPNPMGEAYSAFGSPFPGADTFESEYARGEAMAKHLLSKGIILGPPGNIAA